ncbi:MAG: J domain-containing protein [Chitinophagaceae bacterium]|nr:MAG: J domain-containing protein [Chitinophagaceae bacterium]
MTNCYKVLGVKDFASQEEIKTAYRKLSKKFHPDVNDQDKFFEERFKEVQSAYEVLSDEYKRLLHDDALRRKVVEQHTYRTKQQDAPVPVVKKNVSVLILLACVLFVLLSLLFFLAPGDSSAIDQKYDKVVPESQRPAERVRIEDDRFTLGSTKEEVLKIQGDPTEKYFYETIGEVWYYGFSSVTFNDGRVSQFSNKERNLKVYLNNAGN